MPEDEPSSEAPRFYIVEVKDGAGRYYVICEPTVTIQPGEGWNGISPEELARYIELHKVPAAPLPGRPNYEMLVRTLGAGR